MREHSNALTKQLFFGGIIIAAVLAFTAPLLAYATPTAAEKQAEAQTALASLNALQAELDAASNNYFAALEEQEAAQASMDEAQANIDQANSEIADLQGKLGTRARSMYRSGSLSFIDILLGAATFEEFTTNWDLLNQMNENDAEMVQQTKVLRAEVETQKAEYTRQEQIAADKAEEARKIKEEAEATTAAMQATYDSLSAEAAQLLEEERAAQEAAAAAAAAEAMRQAAQEVTSGGGASYQEPVYNPVTGNAVVDRAYSYVGNAEYVWGACSPGAFDCSGFVAYCLTGSYSRMGTTYTFLGWQRTYEPQPGDVAVNSGHCGIYIGDGQMIHAASPGQGVCIGSVQSGMIFVRY